MIPKHDLILMCFSPRTKIYRNIGCHEEIVSRVEKLLNITRLSRLKSSRNCLTLSPFMHVT
jgi:hypothetical protein